MLCAASKCCCGRQHTYAPHDSLCLQSKCITYTANVACFMGHSLALCSPATDIIWTQNDRPTHERSRAQELAPPPPSKRAEQLAACRKGVCVCSAADDILTPTRERIANAAPSVRHAGNGRMGKATRQRRRVNSTGARPGIPADPSSSPDKEQIYMPPIAGPCRMPLSLSLSLLPVTPNTPAQMGGRAPR